MPFQEILDERLLKKENMLIRRANLLKEGERVLVLFEKVQRAGVEKHPMLAGKIYNLLHGWVIFREALLKIFC